MAKLCPKGKAAAKRKFKVYPSAYANMYASKVCKGKVRSSAKDGGLLDKPKRPRGPMDKPVMTRDGVKYRSTNRTLDRPIQIPKRPPKRKKTSSKIITPRKMREGGMVIENMTKMIEV